MSNYTGKCVGVGGGTKGRALTEPSPYLHTYLTYVRQELCHRPTLLKDTRGYTSHAQEKG